MKKQYLRPKGGMFFLFCSDHNNFCFEYTNISTYLYYIRQARNIGTFEGTTYVDCDVFDFLIVNGKETFRAAKGVRNVRFYFENWTYNDVKHYILTDYEDNQLLYLELNI
jgi:hypothetical protein